jgi:hypothetical protein
MNQTIRHFAEALGPIEGYRGWFPERAGPSNPEDAEVTGDLVVRS